MEDVASLASGGEGFEGGFEGLVLVEFGLEFLRDFEVFGFFELDFQAGFFVFDGRLDEGLDGVFGFGDFLEGSESELAGGLHVLGGLDEVVLGVFEEGAFEEHEGDVVFEGLDDGYVASFKGVAGLAPFEFFGDRAGEEGLAELGHFGLPGFGSV